MTTDAATDTFSTVLEQCAPALRRAALRVTGDAHVADEIVAETLARA
jgi:DNA-directed RNA polymerase specialized sigma24 family protein